MGTTKLKIWNMALEELGQPYATATDDGTLNTQTLSQSYEDVVNFCLEQSYWNFAVETSELATDGTTPEFGKQYAFPYPTDGLRTVLISVNNTYWPPYEAYEEANEYIHTDALPIYLAYVSKATGAGWDLQSWPDTFTRYASTELAVKVCRRLGGSYQEWDDLEQRRRDYLADARSKDAMNEGVKWPPDGRFVRARGHGIRGDRGNRGSLTG